MTGRREVRTDVTVSESEFYIGKFAYLQIDVTHWAVEMQHLEYVGYGHASVEVLHQDSIRVQRSWHNDLPKFGNFQAFTGFQYMQNYGHLHAAAITDLYLFQRIPRKWQRQQITP